MTSSVVTARYPPDNFLGRYGTGDHFIDKNTFYKMLSDTAGKKENFTPEQFETYVDQEFTYADVDRDGVLSRDEYEIYYWSKLKYLEEETRGTEERSPDLYVYFVAYSSRGSVKPIERMGLSAFIRMCRNCKLLDPPKVSRTAGGKLLLTPRHQKVSKSSPHTHSLTTPPYTQVNEAIADLVFYEAWRRVNDIRGQPPGCFPGGPRSELKLDFFQFLVALMGLSQKLDTHLRHVIHKILSSEAPAVAWSPGEVMPQFRLTMDNLGGGGEEKKVRKVKLNNEEGNPVNVKGAKDSGPDAAHLKRLEW